MTLSCLADRTVCAIVLMVQSVTLVVLFGIACFRQILGLGIHLYPYNA